MKFLRFFGPFLIQMGPKLDFAPVLLEQYAYSSAAIKDGRFNEDLNKFF